MHIRHTACLAAAGTPNLSLTHIGVVAQDTTPPRHYILELNGHCCLQYEAAFIVKVRMSALGIFPSHVVGLAPPVHSLLVDDVRVGKAQGAWYHTYANALRFLSKAQEVYLRRREGCIDRGRIAPYGSNGRVQV